jgi:serine/threonine protein kinase
MWHCVHAEDEARQFWRQIVIAVKYMHMHNIAHRDLKVRPQAVRAVRVVVKE